MHRQIKQSDRQKFYSLFQEPEALRYCFDSPHDEDLEVLFTSRLPIWERNSDHWLCLTVEEKSNGNFIGVTGFKKTGSSAEVGFMFLPKYFGKGYATESLLALVKYSQYVGVSELTANITEGNISSVRVVQKCGFKLSKVSNACICIGGKMYNNLEYVNVLQTNT